LDFLPSEAAALSGRNGHVKSSKQTFGRDVRAVIPTLKTVRLGSDDARSRAYRGVMLKLAGLRDERRLV
jgi:hypothetical protein